MTSFWKVFLKSKRIQLNLLKSRGRYLQRSIHLSKTFLTGNGLIFRSGSLKMQLIKYSALKTFFENGQLKGSTKRPAGTATLFVLIHKLNIDRLPQVDVSETFSADQLWFRNISVLFQRCASAENLWTALKTLCFRVENISAGQRWFRADFLWNSAEIFGSEQRWIFLPVLKNGL